MVVEHAPGPATIMDLKLNLGLPSRQRYQHFGIFCGRRRATHAKQGHKILFLSIDPSLLIRNCRFILVLNSDPPGHQCFKMIDYKDTSKIFKIKIGEVLTKTLTFCSLKLFNLLIDAFS